MEATKQTVLDIEMSIHQLKSKQNAQSIIKKDCEVKMATLNNRVRGNKHTIPPNEFRAICRKQDELKRIIGEAQNEIITIKNEIYRKNILREQIKQEVGWSNLTDESEAKKLLISLRNKYMEFSSDVTRISSMRIMASQISEELEAIISVI